MVHGVAQNLPLPPAYRQAGIKGEGSDFKGEE